MDENEWPTQSRTKFTSGDVTCPCGRSFTLYWNGGELDEKLCACGRFYRTEHVQVELVVRQAPQNVLMERRATCTHPATSGGVCQYCGHLVR